ncbi:GntR family transcriptional regulator [Streptomyces hoynatensis]|uniref:GntR family transcriptional regulator n=1 Tax=Streptomyces hoynatensis TaxID=1141874 RepID=A0A3A9YKR2_9ACTN|nr:GntR family transcriptional regulator [Streptomyces hoynatensis]RKN37022.1 GntR family transcriptional regulator [Streptomyces hoynatensis]
MNGLRDADQGGGSAQDQTYRWLKQHIARVPRHDGTFLTEAEVARTAGTSRTPVREALLRLEAEGFLRIVPKKGAFVPPIPDAEVRAVMQARGLIEEWCVRQAAATGGAAFHARLDGLLAEQTRLIGDPVAFIERDRAFHRAVVGQAGNPVLAGFYESLRDRQVRMGLRAVADDEERARAVLAEHAAIVEALRAGEAAGAAAALTAHLAATAAALDLPAEAQPGGEDASLAHSVRGLS